MIGVEVFRSSNSCMSAISRLYSYLDGEVRTLHRVRIRMHLRTCRRCERAYQFEQKLMRLIRERVRVDAPPEMLERIRLSIRERSGR